MYDVHLHAFITLHYVTLRYVTLRYVTLRYVIKLCYTMVPYIALHYIAIAIALHEQINIINHYIRFNSMISMVCFTHSVKPPCFRPLHQASQVYTAAMTLFSQGGRRLGWHVAALAGDPAVDLGDFVRPWAAEWQRTEGCLKPGTTVVKLGRGC